MNKSTIGVWGDMIVVRMDGDIVSRSYPELEIKVSGSVMIGKKAAINLENVNFIDSQGIVFLLRLRDIVEGAGNTFSIYNMKPYVEQVVKRLKLERILNVYHSAEECFAGLAENSGDVYLHINEVERTMLIDSDRKLAMSGAV